MTPLVAAVTPGTASKGHRLVCCPAAMFTWPCFCLTGDLHGDSRHAAFRCLLHGLPLHNGEQQWQRYCPIHSSSESLFAHLATLSVMFPFSSLACSFYFYLSVFFFSPLLSCHLFLSLSPPSLRTLLCQTSPLETKRKFVLFETQPPGP